MKCHCNSTGQSRRRLQRPSSSNLGFVGKIKPSPSDRPTGTITIVRLSESLGLFGQTHRTIPTCSCPFDTPSLPWNSRANTNCPPYQAYPILDPTPPWLHYASYDTWEETCQQLISKFSRVHPRPGRERNKPVKYISFPIAHPGSVQGLYASLIDKN